MLTRVALSLVFAGALAGPAQDQCWDVGQLLEPGFSCGVNVRCLGDHYKKIDNQNVYDCANQCSADPMCLQWTHEPTLVQQLLCDNGYCFGVEWGGTCYLSSIVTHVRSPHPDEWCCYGGVNDTMKHGNCCGMKPGTTTTFPPSQVPAPPAHAPMPGAQRHWAVNRTALLVTVV